MSGPSTGRSVHPREGTSVSSWVQVYTEVVLYSGVTVHVERPSPTSVNLLVCILLKYPTKTFPGYDKDKYKVTVPLRLDVPSGTRVLLLLYLNSLVDSQRWCLRKWGGESGGPKVRVWRSDIRWRTYHQRKEFSSSNDHDFTEQSLQSVTWRYRPVHQSITTKWGVGEGLSLLILREYWVSTGGLRDQTKSDTCETEEVSSYIGNYCEEGIRRRGIFERSTRLRTIRGEERRREFNSVPWVRLYTYGTGV